MHLEELIEVYKQQISNSIVELNLIDEKLGLGIAKKSENLVVSTAVKQIEEEVKKITYASFLLTDAYEKFKRT